MSTEPEIPPTVAGMTKGKPGKLLVVEEKEGKPERESKGEKGSAIGGLGLGLGFSYSSKKPVLQLGQRSSDVGEGVMETVRLHW